MKLVNGYRYYCKYTYLGNISFSRSLLYEINIMKFIKTGLIFTSELFLLFKKYGGGGVLSFDKTVFGINKARLF